MPHGIIPRHYHMDTFYSVSHSRASSGSLALFSSNIDFQIAVCFFFECHFILRGGGRCFAEYFTLWVRAFITLALRRSLFRAPLFLRYYLYKKHFYLAIYDGKQGRLQPKKK
ncbi:hypothetical protein RND81_05G001900 [Saponaria officinalis]|uniref:Uncharacterized protein n=1 Tax=Saponaria officinalis TaxID=3572 RepID=A0AAW1KVZ2_SAPOF